MRAAVGASAQSEVDDGADQQDRQVGHSRIKYPATQRPVADGVDSAGELARAAGADAHASGVGGAAHALEESHHRHAGQVGIAGQRVQRPVWEKSARGTGAAAGALAGTDALGHAADAGTTGWMEWQVKAFEKRLEELVEVTPAMQLLETLPGIAVILSATIALEVGDIGRFWNAEKLASYSGTVPRVHSSGGHTRYGRTRPEVNRYLKWAFAEAANSIAVHQRQHPDWHVSQLYVRLRARKGHSKAVGAVARHLAEAAFHVLSHQRAYRDPAYKVGRSNGGVSANVS